MATIVEELALAEMGKLARAASRRLVSLSTEIKNRGLINIAEALERDQAAVLAGNAQDYRDAQAGGLNEAVLPSLAFLQRTAEEPMRLQQVCRVRCQLRVFGKEGVEFEDAVIGQLAFQVIVPKLFKTFF